MRLFTGIDLSDETRRNIDDLLRQLRPVAQLNWSKPANLHVTTKFIGEWPGERLAELTGRLNSVPKSGPIAVEVRGLGWYPNPHSPRVFWAGIKAAPELAQLATATDRALTELGIAADVRVYAPHLTLARIKPPAKVAALRQAVAQVPSTEFGSFTASSFYLYLSERRAAGSEYTKLAEFALNS